MCRAIYLLQKCLYFDDIDTARKIMKTTGAEKMKAFSQQIKGLDEAKWRSQAKSVMQKVYYLKFSQNEALRKKLLSSRSALVEATDGINCSIMVCPYLIQTY